MELSLRYTGDQVDKVFDQLGKRAPQAIARALNRSIVTARTVMAREIAADTKLGARVVTKELKTRQATRTSLMARVSVSGKKIPLIEWKPTYSKKRGVRAKLPPPGKGHYPHAFIATMKSGHRGVFQRATRGKGSKRLPIYQLRGPSLPAVFSKMSPKAIAAGQESLMKNLAHELSYALSQST
jgi:hypothetical protein